MKMFKCAVCGYVHSGDEAPEKCPKCGAPKEKFSELEEVAIEKVIDSEFTNSIHMSLYNLYAEIEEITEMGIEEDLDPGCVAIFKKAQEEANLLKRMIVAELGGHMTKGKWGI